MTLPNRLIESCRGSSEREQWLGGLPALVRELTDRWALTLSAPVDFAEGSCAWVAVVTREGRGSAVLKLGMPHFEGEHEIQGLRFWNGDPTVRVLEADEPVNAMLLERCEPGTHLRALPDPDQDVVIAGLLTRLWRPPPEEHSFRPLSALIASWRDETLAHEAHWSDAGLVRAGLAFMQELSTDTSPPMLLATDLHAGNVLRAQRQPWLVIDPKPFVGDTAYDATQYLLNCRSRLASRPTETIARFADLLGVDERRVRLWTFARAAADPRDDWSEQSMALARRLAP